MFRSVKNTNFRLGADGSDEVSLSADTEGRGSGRRCRSACNAYLGNVVQRGFKEQAGEDNMCVQSSREYSDYPRVEDGDKLGVGDRKSVV